MSNRIQIPYILTAIEKKIIADNFNSHNDWTKDKFDIIKKNLISHLRIQQNNKCCYCKYELGFDIKQVDIDHIIPKSTHTAFTFEMFNLALSCPSCNTKKSTKPVLLRDIVYYPKNGSNFKIVHPHFDNYSEHIDIVNMCVFIAKSSKGSETITCCELFRLNIVENLASNFKPVNNGIIPSLINELKNGDAQQKADLINLIKDAIR